VIAKNGLAVMFLLLVGCSRSPSFDVEGSLFPAWLLCFAIGIAAAALARWAINRLDLPIAFPVLVYPSLALACTFGLWLVFFQ
jgi:hypothetical protein